VPTERWPERDARLVGVACAVYQAHSASHALDRRDDVDRRRISGPSAGA
jgi:hypothetical protein